MSNAVHVYVSQAHKGELVMGAGIDAYNSYAQRGSLHVIEHQLAAALELFPIFAQRARAAHLGGDRRRLPGRLADRRPDAGRRSLRELRLGHRRASRRRPARAGCSRGRSRTASRTRSNAPFSLDRFTTGALIDEHGAAAVAH